MINSEYKKTRAVEGDFDVARVTRGYLTNHVLRLQAEDEIRQLGDVSISNTW